jgi:hypothetical protein
MIDIDRVWFLYDEVMIGHMDPVVLLSPLRDLLEELEQLRPKPRAKSKAELVAAESERLQIKMFEEGS